MSQEYLEHIFEPFSQEDPGARTTYHGTGLGMSIVHRLVDSLGGTIRVESEKNVGSRFIFTLPFQLDPSPKSSAGGGRGNRYSGVRRTGRLSEICLFTAGNI